MKINKKFLIWIFATATLLVGIYFGYKYWSGKELRTLTNNVSLIDSGNYDQAEKNLQSMIASDPANARPYILLAALLTEKLAQSHNVSIDSKAIIALLDSVDKIAPNSESKRLRATVALLLNQNFNAHKYALESVAIDDNNAKAWAVLGLVAEKQNNFESAEKYYAASYKRDKSNVEALLGQARALWQLGKTTTAKAKAEEAIKVADKRLEKAKAYYTAGHFYSFEKDYAKAIPDLSKSVELSPENYAALGELANSLNLAYKFHIEGFVSTSTLAQALEHSVAAVKINPAYSYGYYFASQSLVMQGRNNEAKNYLTLALKYATQTKASKTFIARINADLANLNKKSK
ncbi:MAG: tetratricopeptide repeat protein [Patescibacteria group bacterium]